MSDRIILVTGSSDGIGKQTARTLAQQGHQVVLHGRDPARLEAARSEIVAATGNDAVQTVVANLASLAAVRALGAELRQRFPRLDVLINNAGIYQKSLQVSEDGYELTMAVNHLAPFLLTHLLLDQLRLSNQGRIVNVSSIAHSRARIDWGSFGGSGPFNEYAAYAQSKLANVLFTVELARRLGPGRITVNALHPGVVSTKLLTEGFEMRGPDSLAEGAATSIYLATAEEVIGVTGKYFIRQKESPMAEGAQDPVLAQRFYQASCELVGIPGLPG